MPDNFNGYSHFSHPSPSGSSDTHSSNGDAASTASSGVGFTEWSRDYDLDALYAPEFITEMTEEEIMECLANIPTEDLLPEPQTIHPGLLQGFQPARNVRNPASSASISAPVAQPNLLNVPRPPFGAVNTWPAEQSQRFFSPPQQARSLSRQPPLRPVTLPTSPSLPIPPNLPSSQASSSSSVRPAGDTQRLSLPAPGDMNYSSCEVIM